MGKIKDKIKKELHRDVRRVKVEVYHDIKYVKTHIPKVITFAIGLTFFIILFAIFKTKQGDKFNQSAESILSVANTKNYVIKPAKAKLILDDKDYQIIDIRSKKKRRAFKIDNSKHIPLEQILAEEYKVFWKNSTKKILTCNTEIESTQAWLILSELGYKNIQVLEGGMEYWKEFTKSEFGFAKDKSKNDELPKYDYAKIMKSFKKKSIESKK